MTHVGEVDAAQLRALLGHYGLRLSVVGDDAALPGSYWGGDEAGLVGSTLYTRARTPLHSLLHEACHFICMDEARRGVLDTDAGGAEIEECAVCYLQVLLADVIEGYGRSRVLRDMDAWGYSFRLGSARRWFAADADDARAWLEHHRLIPDTASLVRMLDRGIESKQIAED